MQLRNLLRQPSLHILNAQPTSAGVHGLDDVEEVGVCALLEETVVFGVDPGVDPVGVEFGGGVASVGVVGREEGF